MNPASLEHLTHILQLSIAPVALISGVGLLLLSMTNRLGRVIDRARELVRQGPTEAEAGRDDEQHILWRRARFLLLAIAFISTAIFLAVLMVAALFAMVLSGTAMDGVVLVLFGVCLACLVASVGFFLGDILLSIRWLRISLQLPDR